MDRARRGGSGRADSSPCHSYENTVSGGLLQGGFVSQGFEATDCSGDGGVAVPFIKIVAAQVGVSRATSEYMEDVDQDSVSHSHDSPLASPSTSQSVVLGCQVGAFGVSSSLGCLYQRRAKPGIPVTRAATQSLTSALVVPRADPRPSGPGSG